MFSQLKQKKVCPAKLCLAVATNFHPPAPASILDQHQQLLYNKQQEHHKQQCQRKQEQTTNNFNTNHQHQPEHKTSTFNTSTCMYTYSSKPALKPSQCQNEQKHDDFQIYFHSHILVSNFHVIILFSYNLIIFVLQRSEYYVIFRMASITGVLG